jgi:hypothetical protein
MSFSAKQGDPLLGPLYGHTATFLVDSRRTNLALARVLVSTLARNRVPCAVLDIDALYSSNSDYIFSSIPEDEARTSELLVPDPGASIEAGMADLLGTGPADALIIDSLNSLYHLLSGGERGSRNMNLGFAVALLSYMARTEKRTVLLTMYERERAARFGRRRSISDLSDLTISARMQGGDLALICERGTAWSGRGLSVSIP